MWWASATSASWCKSIIPISCTTKLSSIIKLTCFSSLLYNSTHQFTTCTLPNKFSTWRETHCSCSRRSRRRRSCYHKTISMAFTKWKINFLCTWKSFHKIFVNKIYVFVHIIVLYMESAHRISPRNVLGRVNIWGTTFKSYLYRC